MNVLDWLGAGLLLLGSLCVLTGAVGMLRLPGFFMRTHAASVTDSAGAGLILLGALALALGDNIVDSLRHRRAGVAACEDDEEEPEGADPDMAGWKVGLFLVLGLVGSAMLYTLVMRPPFEMNVLHDRNPLFVKLSKLSYTFQPLLMQAVFNLKFKLIMPQTI